jgi:hypothetical protein
MVCCLLESPFASFIFPRQICFEACMYAGSHLSIASEVVISNLKKISASSIYESKMKNVCVFHAGSHVCARCTAGNFQEAAPSAPFVCATANKEVGHIVLAEVARLKKLSLAMHAHFPGSPAVASPIIYDAACIGSAHTTQMSQASRATNRQAARCTMSPAA